jgi:hypothetical protein
MVFAAKTSYLTSPCNSFGSERAVPNDGPGRGSPSTSVIDKCTGDGYRDVLLVLLMPRRNRSVQNTLLFGVWPRYEP